MSEVTYIERKEIKDKGYRPNKLMNSVDFSLDVNLGDIFNVRLLKDT